TLAALCRLYADGLQLGRHGHCGRRHPSPVLVRPSQRAGHQLGLQWCDLRRIIVAPTLILLVGAVGFLWAMLIMTVAMIAILGPVVMTVIDLPAARGAAELRTEDPPRPNNVVPSSTSRWSLLGNFGFWTITAPFALALLAQVGFIVHQVALLEPA